MDIKEITKNFKTFTDWIYQQVTDKDARMDISDEDAEMLDRTGYKLICDKGVDMIMAKSSKLSSLNILHKDVSFEVFDKMPKVWSAYQNAVEASIQQSN